MTLKYITYPTEVIFKIAVQQNGLLLEFFVHQSDEIIFEAYKQNKDSVKYFAELTKELKKQFFKYEIKLKK